MRRKSDYWFLLLLLALTNTLIAQEDAPKTVFAGQIKYLQNLDLTQGADSILNNHLIDSRFNFLYLPDQKWTLRIDVRNQLFYGDYLERLHSYATLLDVNNDIFDLSTWVIDKNSVKMLTEIDRAYVRYNHKNLEISAGRQRLDWGMSEVWNPNDIFNPYSYFDFNYEVRRGSDAISVGWHFDHNAKLEFASKMTSNFDDYTGALRYKITQYGYNVQLLSGIMEKNIVLGTGWSGDINGAIGFSGEISYFGAFEVRDSDAFLGSISADYKFPTGTSIMGSYLYNSDGVKDLNLRNFALVSKKPPQNTKDLLIYQTAVLARFEEPFNPKMKFSMDVMVFPHNKNTYFRPEFSYITINNIHLNVVSDIFTFKDINIFDPASFQLYFRAKVYLR